MFNKLIFVNFVVQSHLQFWDRYPTNWRGFFFQKIHEAPRFHYNWRKNVIANFFSNC